MTDAELQAWWPDLGAVVVDLRRIDRSAVADRLLDAVCAGATGDEILGGVAIVLREQRALRSRLGEAAARAWGAVMADFYRAYPGLRLADWFATLLGR